LVEQLIEAALKRRATDIQFIPEAHALRVFERIDGVRRLVAELGKESQEDVLAQVKNRSAMDLAESAKEQFGEFEHGSGDSRRYVCVATFISDEGKEGVTLSFVKQAFQATRTGTQTKAAQGAIAAPISRGVSRGSIEYGI
jgi:type II secretory ATPase GspE/PulE/Tfp pilus assembly ATPase PilB-like protein